METQTEPAPGVPAPFSWSALERRAPGAETSAEDEAREIARALTAHSIVVDPEAVIEEYDDRFASILSTVWGDEPVDGYGLHASLGAFIVAKVAVGMVPAGHTGLRHEPLRRSGIHHVLVDHGIDASTADSILGDFEAVSADFKGNKKGLPPSLLAGLAERTLSRAERNRALSQVAYSPRCLARLAATSNLLSATRAILPVLPPTTLGPRVSTAVTAIVLGRSDRVLALFGTDAKALSLATFIEIAVAREALARAQAPELEDDAFVLVPPLEADATTPHEADAALDNDKTDILDEAFDTSGDDEDDVLEIVEERVDPDAGVEEEAAPRAAVAVARWGATDAPLDDDTLEAWRTKLEAAATLAARRHALLGLSPAVVPQTVAPVAIPPDERILRKAALEQGDEEQEERTERIDLASVMAESRRDLDNGPYDALFPVVRGLLRAAVAAADGRAPTADAIEEAGDAAWATRRIRALALVVQAQLDAAREVTASLSDAAAPEGRWAKDRLMRYGDDAERIGPQEARPAAAALVEDLAIQLARTIAGTVPTPSRGNQD
ncbi:MAG: hypothetical protein RIT81_26880 [Deltaproteobacteria bacterium]